MHTRRVKEEVLGCYILVSILDPQAFIFFIESKPRASIACTFVPPTFGEARGIAGGTGLDVRGSRVGRPELESEGGPEGSFGLTSGKVGDLPGVVALLGDGAAGLASVQGGGAGGGGSRLASFEGCRDGKAANG